MRRTALAALTLLPALPALAGPLIQGPEASVTAEETLAALRAGTTPEIAAKIMANPDKLRNVMDSTYMTKVMAHRAREKGLDQAPSIKEKIDYQVNNLLASAEVEAIVQAKGAPEVAQAAEEYYKANLDSYRTQEMVDTSHILLKVSDHQEGEAMNLLADLRKRILAGEISFEDAAQQHSQDNMVATGKGKVGWAPRGRMVPEYEAVAFAMTEPGSLSEPFKTALGYHLVRFDGRREAALLPFEQVKDNIVQRLLKERRNAIREAYLLEIRDDPKVVLDEPAIQEFLKNPKAAAAAPAQVPVQTEAPAPAATMQ